MKVKIEDVVNSSNHLQYLLNATLPAATALKVALVVQAVQPAIKAFEDSYNKLLAACGKPHDDDPTKFDIVDAERFRSELVDLTAQEIEIPLDAKLTHLGSAELKPATLLALTWLIQV